MIARAAPTVRLVTMSADGRYAALRRLGDLGREVDRHRQPDPYPGATGPAPTLEDLRHRRSEIERLVAPYGVRSLRVFGSVARADTGPNSDLDVLVDMGGPQSLFRQAALQRELEALLGCPVHILTTGGLSQAREHVREQIEHEAVAL